MHGADTQLNRISSFNIDNTSSREFICWLLQLDILVTEGAFVGRIIALDLQPTWRSLKMICSLAPTWCSRYRRIYGLHHFWTGHYFISYAYGGRASLRAMLVYVAVVTFSKLNSNLVLHIEDSEWLANTLLHGSVEREVDWSGMRMYSVLRPGSGELNAQIHGPNDLA